MKEFNLIFIGMDTHKSFIEVAYVEDGFQGQSGQLGRIKTTKKAIIKMVRQFESRYPGATLHFIYEAGPCRYWIYRLISSLNHLCFIFAPSLIPRKLGDRVKTDRRDAIKLALSFKSGDLTTIYVPEEEDEAIRDLSRLRETAMRDLNNIRYLIKAFLLRNHIQTKEKENWSETYMRWLSDLALPHPAQQLVLTEMLQVFVERYRRHERLVNELSHR